jgi:hypothetical protein
VTKNNTIRIGPSPNSRQTLRPFVRSFRMLRAIDAVSNTNVASVALIAPPGRVGRCHRRPVGCDRRYPIVDRRNGGLTRTGDPLILRTVIVDAGDNVGA